MKQIKNCTICSSPALSRLCFTCEGDIVPFNALNSGLPVHNLSKLMTRVKPSKLQSDFIYFRKNQIDAIRQIAGICNRQKFLNINKSSIVRLAVQIGLMAIATLTTVELSEAVAELEKRNGLSIIAND